MPTATETPVPTRTPTPTPVSPYTPLPTWTPIGNKPQIYDYRGYDKEYRDDVNGLGDFMKQSVIDVNDLLAKPDPTNQNWAYKLLAQTTVWQNYFSETTAIIPPDRYQDFHESLKKALSHLKIAADDVNYATRVRGAGSARPGEIRNRDRREDARGRARKPAFVGVMRVETVVPLTRRLGEHKVRPYVRIADSCG